MNVSSEAKNGLVALFVGVGVSITSLPANAQELAALEEKNIHKDNASLGRIVDDVITAIDEGKFFINTNGGPEGNLTLTKADRSEVVYKLRAINKFNVTDFDLPDAACAIFSDGEGKKMHVNAVCVFGWHVNESAAQITPFDIHGFVHPVIARNYILSETLAQTQPTGGFLISAGADDEFEINANQSNEKMCRRLYALSFHGENKNKVPDTTAATLDNNSCYAKRAVKPIILMPWGHAPA